MKKVSIITICVLAFCGICIALFLNITVAPDVTGKDAVLAIEILKNRHLEGRTVCEYSDTVLYGTVISQSTDAGAFCRRGSSVKLVCSLGPEHIAVPDLQSATYAIAEKQLEELGFDVKVTEEFSNHVPAGLVIKQSSKPRELLPKGTVITLTVSKGPDIVSIPKLQGETLDDVKILLAQYKLQIECKEIFSDTVPKGTVIRQDPKMGSTVLRGSTVTLTVSRGVDLVPVPDVSGKTVKIATALLEQYDFDAEFKLVYSDTAPKNIIISQEVSEGTLLRRGSMIVLYVSNGPSPSRH